MATLKTFGNGVGDAVLNVAYQPGAVLNMLPNEAQTLRNTGNTMGNVIKKTSSIAYDWMTKKPFKYAELEKIIAEDSFFAKWKKVWKNIGIGGVNTAKYACRVLKQAAGFVGGAGVVAAGLIAAPIAGSAVLVRDTAKTVSGGVVDSMNSILKIGQQGVDDRGLSFTGVDSVASIPFSEYMDRLETQRATRQAKRAAKRAAKAEYKAKLKAIENGGVPTTDADDHAKKENDETMIDEKNLPVNKEESVSHIDGRTHAKSNETHEKTEKESESQPVQKSLEKTSSEQKDTSSLDQEKKQTSAEFKTAMGAYKSPDDEVDYPSALCDVAESNTYLAPLAQMFLRNPTVFSRLSTKFTGAEKTKTRGKQGWALASVKIENNIIKPYLTVQRDKTSDELLLHELIHVYTMPALTAVRYAEESDSIIVDPASTSMVNMTKAKDFHDKLIHLYNEAKQKGYSVVNGVSIEDDIDEFCANITNKKSIGELKRLGIYDRLYALITDHIASIPSLHISLATADGRKLVIQEPA